MRRAPRSGTGARSRCIASNAPGSRHPARSPLRAVRSRSPRRTTTGTSHPHPSGWINSGIDHGYELERHFIRKIPQMRTGVSLAVQEMDETRTRPGLDIGRRTRNHPSKVRLDAVAEMARWTTPLAVASLLLPSIAQAQAVAEMIHWATSSAIALYLLLPAAAAQAQPLLMRAP